LPISEAYWTRARVGTIPRDVLVQAFERRVLTYSPDNPAGSRVEMGNVGQHYLAWRGSAAPPPPPDVAEPPCPTFPEVPIDVEGGARYRVLQSALHDFGGRRFVSGMVRNDGPTSVAVQVTVVRLDAAGNELGEHTGFTDRDLWPSGQVAAFHIDLPLDAPVTNWQVRTRDPNNTPTGQLAEGFAIGELTGRVDGLGFANVQGRLHYRGLEPFTGIAIVRIHAQDACGSVVTAGFTRVGDGPIAPGSVTDFSAVLLRAEGAVRLWAVVEARVGGGTIPIIPEEQAPIFQGTLDPAPRLPIVSIDGCCQYTRAYQRPDGTPVRSIYRLEQPPA
jgi:hypothetical protein